MMNGNTPEIIDHARQSLRVNIIHGRLQGLQFRFISQDVSFIGFVSRQGSCPGDVVHLRPTGDSLRVKLTLKIKKIAHEMLLVNIITSKTMMS